MPYIFQLQIFYLLIFCCSFGKCVCNYGYTLSKQYMKCFPNIGSRCQTNFDCTRNSDYYRVCANYQCQCKPNYRYSTTTGKCEQFKCQYDSDCHDYDYHRVCRFGDCKCDYGFPERSQSMTCGSNTSYLTFSLFLTSISIIIFHLFVKI